MSVWLKEEISINDLHLWDENARFPDSYFNKNEAELIKYFCDKKNFKILDFIEELIKDFDLPQLEKLVVFRFKGRNIVLEGNRRLTAYKLLINGYNFPDGDFQSRLNTIAESFKINSEFKLECLVTDSKDEGLRFIDRKHLNRNNEVAWGDNERAHHRLRRGLASKSELFKTEITKIIKGLDIEDESKETVLGKGFVTTFWRILESSFAASLFGFSLDEEGSLNIDNDEFEEKLKIIIRDVIQKEDSLGNKINSRTMNTDEQKRVYLDKVLSYEKSQKGEQNDYIAESDERQPLFKEEVSSSKQKFSQVKISDEIESVGEKKRTNPKSYSRKFLIPKTCSLVINEKKINNIFKELKHDLPLDETINSVPNAVGVLFRVFLEVSLDFYAEKRGHSFSNNDNIKNKIPVVLNFLRKEGISEKEFHFIKQVQSSNKSQNILSIDKFHEYVHSYKIQPSASDLKIKWDNLQSFFEILWR